MPSPLDILLHPVSLTILGMYLLLILWEAVFPAKKLPVIPYWKIKGILFFFGFFFLSSYLPLLYAKWLPASPLFDLSGLGTAGGALAGILLYEFGQYVWHRTMHQSKTLWRVLHQMHHSSERLDTYSAFYFSPFDMTGWVMLSTVCFSLVAGLAPQSITIVLLVTNFFGIFTHANIRTPLWLGYAIQRPESHAMHHAKGIHRYNYCDLPVFDMLFGTFRNPARHPEETGFYKGASSRIGDMLLFREVDER